MLLTIFFHPGSIHLDLYRSGLPKLEWYRVYTEFGIFHYHSRSQEMTFDTHRSLLDPRRTHMGFSHISTTFYPKKHHSGEGLPVSGIYIAKPESSEMTSSFPNWTIRVEVLESLKNVKKSTLIQQLIAEKDNRLKLFYPLSILENLRVEYIIFSIFFPNFEIFPFTEL